MWTLLITTSFLMFLWYILRHIYIIIKAACKNDLLEFITTCTGCVKCWDKKRRNIWQPWRLQRRRLLSGRQKWGNVQSPWKKRGSRRGWSSCKTNMTSSSGEFDLGACLVFAALCSCPAAGPQVKGFFVSWVTPLGVACPSLGSCLCKHISNLHFISLPNKVLA